MARNDWTFIKLHDGMPDHPKVEGLSDRAFRMLVTAWCHCSKYRTDGSISRLRLLKIGPQKTVDELVSAGLMSQSGDGNYEIHDYLKHQTSRAQIESVKAKRAEAGRKGGRPRTPDAQANGNQIGLREVPVWFSENGTEKNPEDRRQNTEGSTYGSEDHHPYGRTARKNQDDDDFDPLETPAFSRPLTFPGQPR